MRDEHFETLYFIPWTGLIESPHFDFPTFTRNAVLASAWRAPSGGHKDGLVVTFSLVSLSTWLFREHDGARHLEPYRRPALLFECQRRQESLRT